MFNHVEMFRAIARQLPDAACVIGREQRFTYADTAERVNRFANLLLAHQITIRTPRAELKGWESGQDHVGLCLRNGHEYLEAMLGAAAARAASFNINYRYRADELAYLLNDANAKALVYHSAFAPAVAAAVARLDWKPLLIQVPDRSGQPLLAGSIEYESSLREASPRQPDTRPATEDLYVLYTGGTTGKPKGTLWKQGELFEAVFASGIPESVSDRTSTVAVARAHAAGPRSVFLPLPPFMHGGGQWCALSGLFGGASIVIPDVVDHLDPAEIWRTVEREGVEVVQIVGDAFARPLYDGLVAGSYDTTSLKYLLNGGATLSRGMREQLLARLPHVTLIDGAGSSESGIQLSHVSGREAGGLPDAFVPTPDTCVIDETMTQVLDPGHDGIGWLARGGPLPLGYLGDPEKSARTFREVQGQRMSIPGDRVRITATGTVELIGRDSTTINSGGEKIFAEEVEQALLAHEAVVDVLVVGRPSEHWGTEVVAVVQLAESTHVSDANLIQAAAQQVARYKLPKAIIRVDAVRRSPAGKPDYAWATALVRETAAVP